MAALTALTRFFNRVFGLTVSPTMPSTVNALNEAPAGVIGRAMAETLLRAIDCSAQIPDHDTIARRVYRMLHREPNKTVTWRAKIEQAIVRFLILTMEACHERHVRAVHALIRPILYAFRASVSVHCRSALQVLCLILSKTSGEARAVALSGKQSTWFGSMCLLAASWAREGDAQHLSEAVKQNPRIAVELRALGTEEGAALVAAPAMVTRSATTRATAAPKKRRTGKHEARKLKGEPKLDKELELANERATDLWDVKTEFLDPDTDVLDIDELVRALQPSRSPSVQSNLSECAADEDGEAVPLETMFAEWEAERAAPDLYCDELLPLDR